MKSGAFFINIGRGATTNLKDLADMLQAGEIAGAALDVYEVEPLPSEHPLWRLPNVILTPHVAADGPYIDDRRTEVFVDNCVRFSEGPLLAERRRQGAVVLITRQAFAYTAGSGVVSPTSCIHILMRAVMSRMRSRWAGSSKRLRISCGSVLRSYSSD